MRKKVLSAAATALTALTMIPVAPAAAAPSVQVRPGYTATVRESDSYFWCPQDEVMIGRAHSGDENGYTTYFCGQIYIDNQRVEVLEPPYKDDEWEDTTHFVTPDDYALVRRDHYGDENGFTFYYCARLSWQGKPVRLVDRRWTEEMKESKHSSRAGANEVMTGRHHFGDENGRTKYQYARVTVG
jgi:hypothetical protein